MLRAVDTLCAARDWDGLEDLVDLCEHALERGKQLWPIVAHIDYRIALEAPGDHAATVLDSDLGRFAVGPLTEVAASTHTWAELSPHIEAANSAAFVAQERIMRGEDLTGDERAHAEILDLPLTLQSFEPTYALATFHADHVEVGEVWDPKEPMQPLRMTPSEEVAAGPLIEVLLDVVQPWVAESNGAARACVVEGTAAEAIATLTIGMDGVLSGPLRAEEALQRVAWAAASGGAHGRRRGAAFGRFTAFYVTATLGGLGWPATPEDVGRVAAGLRWYRWDETARLEGWILRIAVEDPNAGWAAALGATDLLSPRDRRDDRGSG